MSDPSLSLDELRQLARNILVAHNTSDTNATQVAEAITRAEADGQQGHGASRIPSYAAQSRTGKVDGQAKPAVERILDAALLIDARSGFAYPALNAAIEGLSDLAPHPALPPRRSPTHTIQASPGIRWKHWQPKDWSG